MKSSKDNTVYVHDMQSAIDRIREYTVDGETAFMQSTLIQDAVLRQLSIIGEAAAKLPSALCKKHSAVPWKQIVGLRNIIIHDYTDVNLTRIWDTIETDLVPLEAALKDIG